MRGRLYIHSIGDKVWLRVENENADIVCDMQMTHEDFSMALIGPSSQEVELKLFPEKKEE